MVGLLHLLRTHAMRVAFEEHQLFSYSTSVMESYRSYLRKLGCPGVCEFGAAVVLGIGGPPAPLTAVVAAILTRLCSPQ